MVRFSGDSYRWRGCSRIDKLIYFELPKRRQKKNTILMGQLKLPLEKNQSSSLHLVRITCLLIVLRWRLTHASSNSNGVLAIALAMQQKLLLLLLLLVTSVGNETRFLLIGLRLSNGYATSKLRFLFILHSCSGTWTVCHFCGRGSDVTHQRRHF